MKADEKDVDSYRGTIENLGTSLSYLIEGSGPTVLVLGSSIYYPRTFSEKFRSSYRLAYADLRHFAESSGAADPNAVTLATYMKDIELIREAIGFERFVLIGHSHHGNLALEYTKLYPDRVSGLVFIGTPPCNVDETISESHRYWNLQASSSRKRILADQKASLNSTDDGFIKGYVAEGPKYWFDPTFDATPLWKDVPVDMNALNSFREFFVDYEFGLDAKQFAGDVLSVMGAHDYVVPHTLWSDDLRNQKNVTFRLLEKSGHTPQLEQSRAFDQIFKEWVGQLQ